MPRHRVRLTIAHGAAVAGLAAVLAGCSGFGSDLAENIKEGNYLNKPLFSTPDWAHVRPTSNASLGPSGPVAPDQLVDAAGHCAPEAAKVEPQAAAAEAKAAASAASAKPAKAAAPPAYGSMAGDLAGPPMPQGPAPKAMPVSVKTASTAPAGMDRLQPEGGAMMGGMTPGALLGGIALGMTECQAVRRGGQPSSVSIGTGKKGRRKVVITYLSGPWPGIYRFESGRLKVVDATPTQEKPKPRYKKKRHRPARTARGEDVYVQ